MNIQFDSQTEVDRSIHYVIPLGRNQSVLNCKKGNYFRLTNRHWPVVISIGQTCPVVRLKSVGGIRK